MTRDVSMNLSKLWTQHSYNYIKFKKVLNKNIKSAYEITILMVGKSTAAHKPNVFIWNNIPEIHSKTNKLDLLNKLVVIKLPRL